MTTTKKPNHPAARDICEGQVTEKRLRDLFRERFRARFHDSAFRTEDDAMDRLEQFAWRAYSESRRAPITAKAGSDAANPDYEVAVGWLLACDAINQAQREHDTADGPSRVLCGGGRLAQRLYVSRRDVEVVALGATGPYPHGRTRHAGRCTRPEPADFRPEPEHTSVQGLRVDGDAALLLALQLLPQPRAGPSQRLDERDLSTLGGHARRDDRDAHLLVPGHQPAQADDGPAALARALCRLLGLTKVCLLPIDVEAIADCSDCQRTLKLKVPGGLICVLLSTHTSRSRS